MHKTLGELEESMSETEFRIWIAWDELKAVKCPNCGVEPKQMMEFETVKVRCPICKYEHSRTRRISQE